MFIPLLAVQLDDKLLIHRQLNIFTLGQIQNPAFVIVAIHFEPARHRAMAREFLRQFKHRKLFAVLANRNFLARADLIRRDIHLAAINGDVSVAHQLPCLTPRLRKTQTKNHVVQTPLELLQQQLAGHTTRARGLLEVVAELAFLGKVNALRFLLFAQLQTLAHDLGLAVFPMLSGSEVALLDGALVAETFRAFEEQLYALAAA